MPYDIRLVKLINGESVIGKWSADGKTISDPAVLQTVPSQQGVQMMLLPFGYPFEQEITGEISTAHVLYEYKKAPEELKTKYLEASSNLTLSAPGGGNISQLLKK
jgi:hypothetical protein